MSISREQVDRLIDEHFLYEHRDDVDGVLATLAPASPSSCKVGADHVVPQTPRTRYSCEQL
jgi:hypothetical protein